MKLGRGMVCSQNQVRDMVFYIQKMTGQVRFCAMDERFKACSVFLTPTCPTEP